MYQKQLLEHRIILFLLKYSKLYKKRYKSVNDTTMSKLPAQDSVYVSSQNWCLQNHNSLLCLKNPEFYGYFKKMNKYYSKIIKLKDINDQEDLQRIIDDNVKNHIDFIPHNESFSQDSSDLMEDDDSQESTSSYSYNFDSDNFDENFPKNDEDVNIFDFDMTDLNASDLEKLAEYDQKLKNIAEQDENSDYIKEFFSTGHIGDFYCTECFPSSDPIHLIDFDSLYTFKTETDCITNETKVTKNLNIFPTNIYDRYTEQSVQINELLYWDETPKQGVCKIMFDIVKLCESYIAFLFKYEDSVEDKKDVLHRLFKVVIDETYNKISIDFVLKFICEFQNEPISSGKVYDKTCVSVLKYMLPYLEEDLTKMIANEKIINENKINVTLNLFYKSKWFLELNSKNIPSFFLKPKRVCLKPKKACKKSISINGMIHVENNNAIISRKRNCKFQSKYDYNYDTKKIKQSLSLTYEVNLPFVSNEESVVLNESNKLKIAHLNDDTKNVNYTQHRMEQLIGEDAFKDSIMYEDISDNEQEDSLDTPKVRKAQSFNDNEDLEHSRFKIQEICSYENPESNHPKPEEVQKMFEDGFDLNCFNFEPDTESNIESTENMDQFIADLDIEPISPTGMDFDLNGFDNAGWLSKYEFDL